jgi:hypothetical protein
MAFWEGQNKLCFHVLKFTAWHPPKKKSPNCAYNLGTLVFDMEAATGLEPVNNGFADRCLSRLAMPPKTNKVNPDINARLTLNFSSGAGNGTRTRDSHVGNVKLYQLSYSRVNFLYSIVYKIFVNKKLSTL